MSAKKRTVNWLGWSRYYLGRSLELVGLFLVTASMIVYFGSSEMRPMLALTGSGAVAFFIGWLLANKNPDAPGAPRKRSPRS